jgi:uncharacterized membrane protein YdjX (TVP38/TMEM64 family)
MRRAEPTASARTAVLLIVASVVVMVVLVAAITPLRDAFSATVHGDTARLRSDLRDWGAVGALVLIALCVIHAVVIFPSEVANAAAGYVYGFWLGLAIVMVGWTASSMVAYVIGQHLGRPALRRLAGRERVERVEGIVERGGATGLLAVRLIPLLPYSGIGYVAGALHVPVWRFTWTTFVGSLPLFVTMVYLGSRLEGLSFSDPAVWIAAAVAVALVVGGHLLARRRLGQSGERASDEAAPAASVSGGRASASPQPQSHASASTSSSGPSAS